MAVTIYGFLFKTAEQIGQIKVSTVVSTVSSIVTVLASDKLTFCLLSVFPSQT